MFKVIGLIGQYDDDDIGTCIDLYRKDVFLPFAPFEGLYVSELHNKKKITRVSYIEEGVFEIDLEDIREEMEYSHPDLPDYHTIDAVKRRLLDDGWECIFQSNQNR